MADVLQETRDMATIYESCRGEKYIVTITDSSRAKRAADEIERLRKAITDIKEACLEGRVCDDVAWFDQITTLRDFCDLVLNKGKAT